jgi:hypothetical protein
MVAPTSGPFTSSVTYAGAPLNTGYRPPALHISRLWHRQKKPYDLPLPFEFVMKMATHRVSEGNGGYLPLDVL